MWSPECLGDSRDYRDRLVLEVPIGDAQHSNAVRHHDLVALAVALECVAVSVGLPAVELDHEGL